MIADRLARYGSKRRSLQLQRRAHAAYKCNLYPVLLWSKIPRIPYLVTCKKLSKASETHAGDALIDIGNYDRLAHWPVKVSAELLPRQAHKHTLLPLLVRPVDCERGHLQSLPH